MIRSAFGPDRTALLPYLTAGLPSPRDSVDLFVAMADAGADGFEVGIPYSDPLMDGPVIQQASAAALEAGTDLAAALTVIEEVTRRTGLPVMAMTYANVIFRTGIDGFCEKVADAGAAGLIVPDLPVEESAAVERPASARGLGTVLFVAPTSSDDRIRRVVERDPAFIYGVAEMGVTGERASSGGMAPRMVERIRAVGPVPIVLGVGISTPEQAAAAGEIADGVIVGTALVRRVLEADSPVGAARSLGEAVTELRMAM